MSATSGIEDTVEGEGHVTAFEWRSFLEQYSRELLVDRQVRADVSAEVVEASWMGYEGASPEELDRLETRIGTTLPESYRWFLATSNGWRQSGGFIYELLPCDRIEWFRTDHQDWIDAYVEPTRGKPPLPLEEHCTYGDEQDCCKFRVECLQSTLLISDVGDSAVYLLNPEVETDDGEWEAWFFANWSPGATRYRSFWDLMQHERQSFVELREHDEKRYFPEDGLDTLPEKLPHLSEHLAEKADEHRSAKEQRASRDGPQLEDYTDAVVSALADAELAARRLAESSLTPDELFDELKTLAHELESGWKSGFKRTAATDRGRAEGDREAMGIVRWFLDLPST